MQPICRVCMTSSGVLIDIFTKMRETFPTLEFMINECVEVKVTRHDNFPKQICKICLSDVQAAFRFKRNYELTLRQFNKKLDLKESKKEDIYIVLSDNENNTEDVSTCNPKTTTTIKRPKKKESERASEEYLSEESQNEESQCKASPDLKESSDESINSNSDKEYEPRDLSVSESPSVEEDAPKRTNKITSKTLTTKQENVYICKTCDKVYKRKSDLSRHMNFHFGACKTVPIKRIFKCDYCDQFYRWKANLKRHVKRIHA
ncbi:uncharacterized zinc finger protein CG2678-like [Drosophila innubila]|uniref:uncharacterized zinc finger protein CG2678-like n=1 Tax=Drosophila innubila TaxID=198719 RepID=UPI00148E7916|nr:uncharacterized zinc finger protein CG2678-like [Drosophila innubila]